MANLKLEGIALIGERNYRIILGAKMIEIKIDCITLEDKFRVLLAIRVKHGDSASSVTFPRSSPLILVELFFKSCTELIGRCREKALPKLAVEALLFFARISRVFETCRSSASEKGEMATKYSETAKNLLEEAVKLCDQGFRGIDTLLEAANESLKLLQKSYKEITADELEAIKRAMISGPQGIATHSGYWYNCVNGHLVRSNYGSRYITIHVLTRICSLPSGNVACPWNLPIAPSVVQGLADSIMKQYMALLVRKI